MSSRYQRLLKLEEKHLTHGIKLTAEQIKSIEQANPCFKERHIESKRPGELLSQDTLYVGQIKGIDKVYMQSVVDTYGSFAFGYLHTGKLPDQAALVLHNDVLPFYRQQGIKVAAILTDTDGNIAEGRRIIITKSTLNSMTLNIEGQSPLLPRPTVL